MILKDFMDKTNQSRAAKVPEIQNIFAYLFSD